MIGIHENRKQLQSKQHFLLLDGLRGIAALAVVIFHFMEWIYPDPAQNFIGHGFLAVDFFFCLSGFVIAYAYDDRINRVGFTEFLKSRIIRLHPLVVFGAVLGFIGYIVDPFSSDTEISGQNLLLLLVTAMFLIPLPIMQERAYNMFAFNAPAWSLFWEYIASIAYGLFLWRLRRELLAILQLAAAVGILYISHKAGNLLGGWSKDNWLDGGVRVSYSFLAGMVIFRYRLIIKNSLGFAGLSILLAVAFLMPANSSNNWIAEAIVVLIYFPLIVSLGAGSSLSSRAKPICKFSGDISYPLYMTHYAGIWIFGNYLTTRKPTIEQLAWIIPVSTLLMIALAFVVLKLYDSPIKNFFNKKRKAVTTKG